MKKRLSVLLFACLLLFVCLVPTVAKTEYPEPTSAFFVNDFSGCLSRSDAAEMQKIGEALYKATGAQAVVVTVPTLGGESIEDYGYDLANEWGIGDKDADSGVLLLLSTGDRKVRIEVGKGLEGCLPDGKTGRILDSYAIPYLKSNDFSTGLLEAYKVVVNEIYVEYGQTPSDYIPMEESDYEEDMDFGEFVSVMVPFALFVILIIFSIFRGGGPSGRGRRYYGGFYGGGFSGGSSHRSGGFSGGGGSFGGGGSSRGF